MSSFISELGRPIAIVKEGEGFLMMKTRIDYYRTTKERKCLDEIANMLGMRIESDDGIPERNYELKIDGKTPLTLVSKRKGKSLESIEPLEIKVNLEQPIEPAKKFVKSLIEKFSKKKKNS